MDRCRQCRTYGEIDGDRLCFDCVMVLNSQASREARQREHEVNTLKQQGYQVRKVQSQAKYYVSKDGTKTVMTYDDIHNLWLQYK
jgi:hypothetical protein